MSRKEQYPGGVKLTEKTARTLAMQEFGTARGLTKSTSFVGAYFMEFGNLRIEICADAACIAVRVVLAHGTGSSVKYFDPYTLQENFKAIVAPGWSDKSNVAAVMTAKADAINTVFTGAKALIDADTNTVRHYADVPAWKKTQNMNSKAEILCWPMFGLGDRAFHASVHAAGLMGKTDSDNGGCPAESPSNKTLQIDRAMLADGTTVLLDLAQANYLNSNGIVTALNFIGSYVLWGDETACFPADTDVKNYFISVSRMFGWVARSVILTYWSKIDKKMTRRLIDSIVDSVNIWLNGLVSEEKLLGARVEFLDEENSTTALMAGKAVFHIYMTPASPMRECEFVLEYDADYVTAALSA